MWVSCFREEWKRQKGVNFYDCTIGIWGEKNFMSDVLEGWGGGQSFRACLVQKNCHSVFITQFSPPINCHSSLKISQFPTPPVWHIFSVSHHSIFSTFYETHAFISSINLPTSPSLFLFHFLPLQSPLPCYFY